MVIWTGDINASVTRAKNTKNNEQTCTDQALTVSQHMPTVSTYYTFNTKCKDFTIDLFIHRKNEDPIENIKTWEKQPLNTSSHNPVTATLKVTLNKPCGQVKSTPKTKAPHRIHWDKVDKPRYRAANDVKLMVLQKQMNDLPSGLITVRFNSILAKCAGKSYPPPPMWKRRTRYKWHASFSPAAQEVNRCYREWRSSGCKDQSDPKYTALQAAKRIFRKA